MKCSGKPDCQNMAINQLTVLQDLPKFTGNPKEGDPPFTSDIDARTFLRTIENHFLQNDITANERKLQILFSLIDKKKGDAIKLLTCYAGKRVSFDEVKAEFLNMYPSFKVTEFRHAAQALLGTKLRQENMFCGMTALENASRAVAEAYLKNDALTHGDFGERTILPATIPVPPPQPSTSTPPAVVPQAASPTTLLNVLQNFVMHLFLASQTANKVYDKLANYGPRNSSTKFMAETVKTVEKYKLLTSTKKPANTNEVIWQVRRTPPPLQPQPIVTELRNAGAHSTVDNNRPPIRCHNCNQIGHVKRECKTCSFCTRYGHTAKLCKARIAQAKGKYCNNCRIRDSHNTAECFSKTAREQSRKTPRTNVRLVYEDEPTDENAATEQNNDEWAPNLYDPEEENAEPDQY